MSQRVRHASGFTLIEIMLVMVVLGVVSAVAVIRAPAGTRQLEVEAARFAAALAVMSEQAIIRGVPHAIDVGAAQYRLREFRHGEWTTKSFAAIAPVHELPPSIQLELVADAAAPGRAGRIVLLPSGAATADGFRLTDQANGDVVRYAAATTGYFERVP